MKNTFTIHQVAAMRDAHKALADGEKGYIFSWGFRRRLASNFIPLEQAVATFEASVLALAKKHGAEPDQKTLPEAHKNYAAWVKDMMDLTREKIELELKPLGIDEFNGDENKTLPADILIKLDPIIEG